MVGLSSLPKHTFCAFWYQRLPSWIWLSHALQNCFCRKILCFLSPEWLSRLSILKVSQTQSQKSEGGLALTRARVNGIFYHSCIVHGGYFSTWIVHRGLAYIVHRLIALMCTVHGDLYARAHVHRPPQGDLQV